MKVAISGKGGTGKTTIAGILSRSLARSGCDVVAVDADPNPNLAVTLGLGLEKAAELESVTNVLLHEKAEHSHEHDHSECETRPEGAEALLADIGVTAPDGVRLIQTGIIERPAEGCLCCGSHRTSRRIFDEIDGTNRVVVADLEAGVIDLMWVWPKPEDSALIVTEPYIKSLEVARRALEVTKDFGVGRVLVIANRVADGSEADRVRAYLPGYEVLVVPDDPAIGDAAALGTSPVDASPLSPAVGAVEEIGQLLLKQESASA